MKYLMFGYDQKELMKYDIDTKDLIILDYLKYQTFNSNLEYVIYNDYKYIRITNENIVEDLPILKLTPRGMKNRIDKLAKKGFIKRIQKQNANKVKKSYMIITNLCFEINN